MHNVHEIYMSQVCLPSTCYNNTYTKKLINIKTEDYHKPPPMTLHVHTHKQTTLYSYYTVAHGLWDLENLLWPTCPCFWTAI
jgi:hypothetical protein